MRGGKGGRRLGRVGFAVQVKESSPSQVGFVKPSLVRLRGLTTTLWFSSWDGLVDFSAKPAISSGPFGALESNLHVPPSAC
jgi:hypothetical protein